MVSSPAGLAESLVRLQNLSVHSAEGLASALPALVPAAHGVWMRPATVSRLQLLDSSPADLRATHFTEVVDPSLGHFFEPREPVLFMRQLLCLAHCVLTGLHVAVLGHLLSCLHLLADQHLARRDVPRHGLRGFCCAGYPKFELLPDEFGLPVILVHQPLQCSLQFTQVAPAVHFEVLVCLKALPHCLGVLLLAGTDRAVDSRAPLLIHKQLMGTVADQEVLADIVILETLAPDGGRGCDVTIPAEERVEQCPLRVHRNCS
mmetsp:Transcript_68022/g.153886  ORF Transcript_68022/g.153886 Transcript_68022/m.153886 type:complete len:261 (-) Transcript_68022:151-933(-)